jgi:glutamate-1-semialdehyde 2,1-aminomutase
LQQLSRPGVYEELEEKSSILAEYLASAAVEAGVKVSCNRVASMQCMFFTEAAVTDYSTATTSDTKMFAGFFRAMLEQGVYLAPSQYEAAFVSTAHSKADLEAVAVAAKEAFKQVAQ